MENMKKLDYMNDLNEENNVSEIEEKRKRNNIAFLVIIGMILLFFFMTM